MSTEAQAETRTERVTMAITPGERRAIDFVALANGLEHSSVLLRSMGLEAIVAEYRRMMEAINGNRAAA